MPFLGDLVGARLLSSTPLATLYVSSDVSLASVVTLSSTDDALERYPIGSDCRLWPLFTDNIRVWRSRTMMTKFVDPNALERDPWLKA